MVVRHFKVYLAYARVATKRLRMCGTHKIFHAAGFADTGVFFCHNAQVTNSHQILSNSVTLSLGIIPLKLLIQTSLRCIAFSHGILLPSFMSFTEVKKSAIYDFPYKQFLC